MFELLHDLAYDHEGRDRSHYKLVAQVILKQHEPPLARQRLVELSRAAYVELKTALLMTERWCDADVHRPNCVLYAGYAQPELRKHMSELVFVPQLEDTGELFRGHRLLGLHCDHAKGTDVATCECGWMSPEMVSVGAAFDSWATHLRSKK